VVVNASATDSVEVAVAANASATECGVVENGATRSVRVVVSISASYFPVFVNWLLFFGRICPGPGLSSLYIICLDAGAEKLVPTVGLTCSAVHHSTSSEMWPVRNKFAQGLLQQGHDVVLSDSDAYWIRNPYRHIEKSQSDIVSSRGSYPFSESSKLGASLCMGFTYIRSSNHTARLWGEVVNEIATTKLPGDQRDINSLLARLGLQYPPPKPVYAASRTPDTGHFTHDNYKYSVTLLPHFTFRRTCDPKKPQDLPKSVVVAHCLVHDKAGKSKLAGAEALGLWRLKDNWSETPYPPGDLDGFLASLVRPGSKWAVSD
jgi:hypothetical protein